MSGISMDLELGLLLFVVYINDLDMNEGGLIGKLSDAMKIGGVRRLRGDLIEVYKLMRGIEKKISCYASELLIIASGATNRNVGYPWFTPSWSLLGEITGPETLTLFSPPQMLPDL
eukprot:g37428.t1